MKGGRKIDLNSIFNLIFQLFMIFLFVICEVALFESNGGDEREGKISVFNLILGEIVKRLVIYRTKWFC